MKIHKKGTWPRPGTAEEKLPEEVTLELINEQAVTTWNEWLVEKHSRLWEQHVQGLVLEASIFLTSADMMPMGLKYKKKEKRKRKGFKINPERERGRGGTTHVGIQRSA